MVEDIGPCNKRDGHGIDRKEQGVAYTDREEAEENSQCASLKNGE